MFDKRYKKTMEILDKKIDYTFEKFNATLEEVKRKDGMTDQEIYDEFALRGRGWSQVDKLQAKLDALCELKRELLKEIGEV